MVRVIYRGLAMSWGRWNHSCSFVSCPTPTCMREKDTEKQTDSFGHEHFKSACQVNLNVLSVQCIITTNQQASLSPWPGRNLAPQSMPSSVCLQWRTSRPPAGQKSSGKKWVCGQQPAGGTGRAHCGHRSGLYLVPADQHATPSESPRRNSTLGGEEKSKQGGKEG